MGESGSGKTSLVNLISGLVPPDEGRIEIDGTNLYESDKLAYQKKIGYITQEPMIFNDTVFNNVTFWAKPTEASRQRFAEAIRKASLSEFLSTLPMGENTVLEYGGINLSGGQRQRIAIARELYKDIDILFMDEATSALDSSAEKEIQSNIDYLQGHLTIVMVAHRLSTVKRADIIYVLRNGSIDSFGTYEELMNNSRHFSQMVTLQRV